MMARNRRALGSWCATLLALSMGQAAGAAVFESVAPVGLPGPAFDTEAQAVSADGRIVLGNRGALDQSASYYLIYDLHRAFLWEAGATTLLGGENWSGLFLSDDGTTVVGNQLNWGVFSIDVTRVWSDGAIIFETPSTGYNGYTEWLEAVSPDGLSIAGRWQDQVNDHTDEFDDYGGLLRRVGGANWEVESLCGTLIVGAPWLRGRGSVNGVAADNATAVGTVECTTATSWSYLVGSTTVKSSFVRHADDTSEIVPRPGFPGFGSTTPVLVSRDGSTVIADFDSAFGTESLVWSASAGSVRVADLPGMVGVLPDVTLVSDDGGALVGTTQLAGERVGFRWEGGAVELLDQPVDGFDALSPQAMTPDGRTIVGNYEQAGSPRTFIFTHAEGTRDLQTLLESKGVDLSTWSLDDVADISHDGRVIVGTAERDSGMREAWRADLSPPDVPLGALTRFGLPVSCLLGALAARRFGGRSRAA